MGIGNLYSVSQSALRANRDRLSATSNNLANALTNGYESQRVGFKSRADGGVASVDISNEARSRAGSVLQTGGSTDLSLNGSGFFVVEGNADGRSGQFYTRDGQFHVDKNGHLVTSGGLRVQGYGVDSDGNIDESGGVQDLKVAGNVSSPQKTGSAELEVNLDASADARAPGSFDLNDPSGTSHFSSSITITDSQGKEIDATVHYTKTNASSPPPSTQTRWDYNVTVDEGDVESSGTNGLVKVGSGSLDFDQNGELVSHDPAGGSPAISLDPEGAPEGDLSDAQLQKVDLSFEGSTQYSAASTTRSISTDGRQAGSLQDFNVQQDGTIVGAFSDGSEQKLGRVAVADFSASSGLEAMDGNLWASTSESGNALLGTPGTGGRGTVSAGTVTGSGVDIAREMTNLIKGQRAYEANLATIETSNEIQQAAIDMVDTDQ